MKKLTLFIAIVSLAACKKSETLPDNFSTEYASVNRVNGTTIIPLDCTLHLTTVNDTVTFELVGANTGTFKGIVTGSGKASIITDNGVAVTGNANYGYNDCEITYTVPINNVLQKVTATK
jgi:hypothetical protein